MADDVRDISVRVLATQAIRDLTKMGVALEQMGGSVGKSDAELKKLDRQLLRVPDVAQKAARTIAQLRNEINTMSKQQTAAGNSIKSYEQRLITANKRLAEQQQIVRTQKSLLQTLIKDNLSLANSYNQIATAAGGATTAQNKAALKASPAATGTTKNSTVPLVAAAAVAGAAGGRLGAQVGAPDVQWNALRYQLYDVAATFGVVGAAATMTGLAVVRAGITWDKNFANVVRTAQVTGSAVEWLKEEFLELQSAIPVTSADLATIGTLGAQMGVAASNLANFTEITAKFSATSGLNVEEAATALSRLDQLLPDVRGNYERLGSTILRTGVNAVATEAQIVRGTSQIASMGQIAGLTTPEVVALSSAMSSLGFSPELQRSVVTSSFSRILTATSAVTDQTEKFGAVLNMTGKEFQAAWRSDAVGTYTNLLQTIAGRGDAVTVLKDLGLASQRLTPNLLKMGQNTEVLNAALSDTRDEWGKNGEMARQYGVIANTVSARIQVLGQTWEALLVTLDSSDVILKPVISGLTEFLKMLRRIAQTPGVSTFVSITAAVVTLSGVLALGAAALAGMAAGYIAITSATAGLAAATGVNTAATKLNTGAVSENAAVRAAASLGLGAQLTLLNSNTTAMGANTIASSAAGSKMLGFSSSVISALPSILKWTSIIGVATAVLGGFVALVATAPDWMYDLEKSFNGINTPEDTFDFNVSNINKSINKHKDLTGELKRLKAAQDNYVRDFDKTDAYNSRSNEFLEMNGRKYKNPNWREPMVDRRATAATEKEISETSRRIKAIYDDLESEIMDLQTPEDQFRALNHASEGLGISTEDLLKKMPSLNSLLGDGAVMMAGQVEEADRLVAAQELWAGQLGRTEEELKSLQSAVTSGANAYLDFGTALSNAYDGDGENGEGFSSFVRTMNNQISGFEKFYGQVGELVQKGGTNLATLFAAQGPAAATALSDALKLSPENLAQIESQMSLAAFYASEEFANTFAQNNSILARVWQQSGQNPEAVAAFNAALSDSMKGGSIDPNILAGLAAQFEIDIPVGMIPGLDPQAYEDAVLRAEAAITPIEVPAEVTIHRDGTKTTEMVTEWQIELDGHRLQMDVDPNTEEGAAIIRAWRDNEFKVPIELQTRANTLHAKKDIDSFITAQAGRRIPIYVQTITDRGGNRPVNPGQFATGGIIGRDKGKQELPRFATGGSASIFRGPGTGTSDSILARVSNGEAITRAAAVRYYGTKLFDDLNHMRIPRYANGGFPGGMGGQAQSGPQQVINATVVQNYPTTQDPIKTLKQDAESVIAGIWT